MGDYPDSARIAKDRLIAGGALFRWHRWLGVVACWGILFWGLSAITHPFMSRLKPQPATQSVPRAAFTAEHILPLAQILTQAKIEAFEYFRVFAWADKIIYQIEPVDSATLLYFDGHSGADIPDGERLYAEFLARHYLAEHQARVTEIMPITRFEGEYNFVNRLLPVYRVRFDRPDGLRAYVDTRTGQLATLVDERKAALHWVFRKLHNWEFLAFSETLRVAVMLFFTTVAFISACSGLWLYGYLWRKRWRESHSKITPRGLRRYHHGIGITVAITALMFTFSGGFHLFMDSKREHEVLTALDTRFTFSEIALPLAQAVTPRAIDAITLSKLPQGVFYRIATTATKVSIPDEHEHTAPGMNAGSAASPSTTHYVNAQTGELLPEGEHLYARYLAAHFSGQPADRIASITPITRFDEEYTAFYKHLPVYRVQYKTSLQDRYYIDTTSGELAAHLSQADVWEDWSFDTLHKWHFLGNVGPDKWLRDAVTVILPLCIVAVAILGLILFLRRLDHG